jgi:hypothetical protein
MGEIEMTILQSLLKSQAKAVAAPVVVKQSKLSPIEKARDKLVELLTEQLQLIDNPSLVREKRATRKVDGVRQRTDVKIAVKSWVSMGMDEKPILALRYAGQPLELSPGKSALSITSGDVKGVLKSLIEATAKGELDVQLGKASQSTRAKFKKAK